MGGIGLEHSSENISEVSQNTALNDNTPTAPEQERVQNQVQILQTEPGLTEIITAWPDLPEHIKQTIRTLAAVTAKENTR